jgi:hypothetical protein
MKTTLRADAGSGRLSLASHLALACGILSSLLYVAMNIVGAMRFEGYSSISQTVSELSAIGAPTRSFWVPWGIAYGVLMSVFAWGVVRSAGDQRALRVVGGLLIAYGVICVVWPFAPMHLRGQGFTLTDTMHIVFAMLTVVLMLLAIGFGAAAFGKHFRVYSIATMVLLLGFGVLTTLDAPRIAPDLPTPWVGLWERINIAVFLLWVVVLAVVLLRTQRVSEVGLAFSAQPPSRPKVPVTS